MRISKKLYYLKIAKTVSLRSPCLRRKNGAVIVKDDMIVSTGYNGPARGEPHCTVCLRTGKKHNVGMQSVSEYTICPAVHAEENAVINAGREKALGATLYLYSQVINSPPCYRCERLIKNAGIKQVIWNDKEI